MGLREKIVSYLGHEYVESLEEKDPALFVLIDGLNEMTVFEAYALYLDKRKQLGIKSELTIDYTQYFIRFTREPFTVVLGDLLKEFGLDMLFGVSPSAFLDAIAMVGEDGK